MNARVYRTTIEDHVYANYRIVTLLLATFNDRIIYKISINFVFHNKKHNKKQRDPSFDSILIEHASSLPSNASEEDEEGRNEKMKGEATFFRFETVWNFSKVTEMGKGTSIERRHVKTNFHRAPETVNGKFRGQINCGIGWTTPPMTLL